MAAPTGQSITAERQSTDMHHGQNFDYFHSSRNFSRNLGILEVRECGRSDELCGIRQEKMIRSSRNDGARFA